MERSHHPNAKIHVNVASSKNIKKTALQHSSLGLSYCADKDLP